MVTPSQVRSETSSETLKLNIQLRVTSTPPPASTLLLVTAQEYHIIDLRRCSAPVAGYKIRVSAYHLQSVLSEPCRR